MIDEISIEAWTRCKEEKQESCESEDVKRSRTYGQTPENTEVGAYAYLKFNFDLIKECFACTFHQQHQLHLRENVGVRNGVACATSLICCYRGRSIIRRF